MTLKTKFTTSNFKPWEEKAKENKRKITELKQKKPKQAKPVLMSKNTWKNFIEDLLLSPLIKHQTISHLYAGK